LEQIKIKADVSVELGESQKKKIEELEKERAVLCGGDDNIRS